MNREQRRSVEKKARKKLTDDQFEKFQGMANDKVIISEVDRRVTEMFDKLTTDLIVAMKENRISEDRIARIVSRTLEIGKERQLNERLS